MPHLSRSLAGVALSLWLGAVLMTGAAAAIAFPQMRDLAPVLPDFAGHEPDHWSIAAGHAMLPVFRVLDFVTLALAALAVVFTGFTIRSVTGRVGITLWLAGLIGAGSLGVHHALTRSPDMQEHAHAYWDVARKGDATTAATHKAEFDRAHPVASNVLKTESALLALAIVGWTITRPHSAKPSGVAR